jgi:hypothetical protein
LLVSSYWGRSGRKGKIDISYYKMKIKNEDNYVIQTNKCKRLRGSRIDQGCGKLTKGQNTRMEE